MVLNFNPRSPWGERLQQRIFNQQASRFQSTLPVGGATDGFIAELHRGENFNPRSPWGERRNNSDSRFSNLRFQSTLPVGGATVAPGHCLSRTVFQSTLPVGGATNKCRGWCANCYISIHAPRGGSDPNVSSTDIDIVQFQSTLPVGGATSIWIDRAWFISLFQSTLPVGGATGLSASLNIVQLNFNPRSPWGERPAEWDNFCKRILISIHAPRGGSDLADRLFNGTTYISIHAPRGGSDLSC